MLLRILFLTITLVFSLQASAKSPSIVGSWELLEKNNTHVNLLQGEHKFLAAIMMEMVPEIRFYRNGKFLTPKTPMQGYWKKEKMAYAWHTINNVGQKNTFKLILNQAGNLSVHFDKNIKLIYSRVGAKKIIKRKKQALSIAQVKKTIPYEKMFRTQEKDFMGYFHFLLISRDGQIYTMGTSKIDRISAKAFKLSALSDELLIDKAFTTHYTVTPKAIFASSGKSDVFKIISSKKVSFRDKVYYLQRRK